MSNMSLKLIDAPVVVEQLISTKYTLSKVLNPALPIIKMVYNLKKINVGATNGGIWTYQISDNVSYQYSSRKRKDVDYRVSIDLRFRDREYLLSNLAHIREILEDNSTAIKNLVIQDSDDGKVTGANYENPFVRIYEMPGAQDLSDKRNNFHRYVLDVELQILGRIRST